LNSDSVSCILVPITNIMNDLITTCPQRKTIRHLTTRNTIGNLSTPMSPYDYIKGRNYKHALLIDNKVAKAVKQIFPICLRRMTVRAVINHLNNHDALKRKTGIFEKENEILKKIQAVYEDKSPEICFLSGKLT